LIAINSGIKAINFKPTHPWAYSNRGVLYKDKGEKELALKDYNQAILLNPKNANAYANRGILYAQMNNLQQAIQDLKTAAKLFYEQGNPVYQQVLEKLKQLGQ
jgi:tetratricopeptide (TPR) repeat protein